VSQRPRLHVGQTIYWVTGMDRPTNQRQFRDVVITKVGSKYAYTEHLKICMDTWAEYSENYSHRAQGFISKVDYEERMQTKRLWSKFRGDLPYDPPETITTEWILAACQLLNIRPAT